MLTFLIIQCGAEDLTLQANADYAARVSSIIHILWTLCVTFSVIAADALLQTSTCPALWCSLPYTLKALGGAALYQDNMMHGATGMQDSNGAIRAPQGLKVLESDAAKEQKLAAMVCSLTAKR